MALHVCVCVYAYDMVWVPLCEASSSYSSFTGACPLSCEG